MTEGKNNFEDEFVGQGKLKRNNLNIKFSL